MKPTDEQYEALEIFGRRKTFVLNAYAGTGKTSTVELMARSTKDTGLYIAFNRSIAQEAKRKLPKNITVKTSHALAFHAARQLGYSNNKLTRQLNAHAIRAVVDVKPLTLGDIALSQMDLASAVRSTVQQFTYSADKNIFPSHISRDGILQRLTENQWKEYSAYIIRLACDLWKQMTDKNNDDIFLGHDGYFKVWSLLSPQLNYNFIFVDEAQDSNPALLSVLEKQHIPVVLFGDRFQQIYQWRGAINAMETMKSTARIELTKSFRFGDEIADVATNILQIMDSSVQVHGTGSSQTYCETPNIILSRTNPGLIRQVILAKQQELTFHIIGGTAELQLMLRDVTSLKNGRRAIHSELYGFKNWKQVQNFTTNGSNNPLSTFVRLVDEYNEDRLIDILKDNIDQEKTADRSFSTVHKAKGLEYDNVVLDGDFPEPKSIEELSNTHLSSVDKRSEVSFRKNGTEYRILKEELRILYVAATRSRKQLQLPDWVYDFFELSNSSSIIENVQAEPKVSLDIDLSSNSDKGNIPMGSYAVVDFETSGLYPQSGDRAIEIGIVLIKDGTIVDKYESLLNSEVTIHPEIEQLTGITQKMVDRAPPAEKVMREANEFVKGSQLVAHNANFDKKFWERELRRIDGSTQISDFLCTLLISRRLFQGLPNHKLGTVSSHLGISIDNQHRAIDDAIATAKIFIEAYKRIGSTYETEQLSNGFIKKYQKTSKKDLAKLSIKTSSKLNSTTSSEVVSSNTSLNYGSLGTDEITISEPESTYYKNGKVRGLQAHMHHTVLEQEKTITGSNALLLEKKITNQISVWNRKYTTALKQQEKKNKLNELEELEQKAELLTKNATRYIQSLNNILNFTLSINDAVDWNLLRDHTNFSTEPENYNYFTYDSLGCPIDIKYNAAVEKRPEPPEILAEPSKTHFQTKPTFWQQISFQSKSIRKSSFKAYKIALSDWNKEKKLLENEYKRKSELWDKNASLIDIENQRRYDLCQSQITAWNAGYQAHAEKKADLNSKIDQLQKNYIDLNTEAVEEYCNIVLSNSLYPEGFPQNFTVEYDQTKKQLIVNYQLPSITDLDFIESASVVRKYTELREKYLSSSKQKIIYGEVIRQTTLRTIHELYEADVANAIEHVVFNGFVCALDEAIGHDVTVCITSIECDKATFLPIDLSRIDTQKCYDHLKGRGNTNSFNKFSPVEKYADKTDTVFVSARDIDLYI